MGFETDTEAARAMFQSYDGMEGLDAASRELTPKSRVVRLQADLSRVYPGLLVAATIALAATWLSQHYNSPVMLFALLFGMTFHFLHEEGRCVQD